MSAFEVYETLLVRRGELVEPVSHWRRFERSALLAGLPPLDLEQVQTAALSACASDAAKAADGRLRLVWGTDGLAEVKWEPIPDRFEPAHVIWSGEVRESGSRLTRAKVWRLPQNLAAAHEAAKAGVDEALMLNERGFVAEGYRSNVFAVIDGVAWTPPLTDGALPGTARGWLLQGQPGLVRERSLRPEELLQADELLLTSAIRLVQPVARLAGQDFTVLGKIGERLLAVLTSRRSTP